MEQVCHFCTEFVNLKSTLVFLAEFNGKMECQCDANCEEDGNCCEDYQSLCTGSNPSTGQDIAGNIYNVVMTI